MEVISSLEYEEMKQYQKKANRQRQFLLGMTVWNALVGLIIVINVVKDWL